MDSNPERMIGLSNLEIQVTLDHISSSSGKKNKDHTVPLRVEYVARLAKVDPDYGLSYYYMETCEDRTCKPPRDNINLCQYAAVMCPIMVQALGTH